MSYAITEVVGLIARECNEDGPSERCREVLKVAIVDYGGNVHGHATTPRGALRIKNSLRVPTRFQVEKVGRVVDESAYMQGYTVDCGHV